MTDNVTPIGGRTTKGTFAKGTSGNPAGVSAKRAAIKQMQKDNEVLLTSILQEMVPAATKLHKALLKSGELSNKEAIELIKLTYEYGHGKPRQAEAPKAQDNAAETGLEDMSPEMLREIEKMIAQTRKDASKK